MTTDRPAGPYPLPGVTSESWLVRFDESGACTSPKTRDALVASLATRPDAPVVLISHGWNNDFGDATRLYAGFIQHFESRDIPTPAPIFVGVIWPSIWLPGDDGPQLGASPAEPAPSSGRDALVAAIADALPPPGDRGRVRELLTRDRLSRAEALDLCRLLQPVIRGAQERAPDHTDPVLPGADEGSPEAAATAEDILRALETLQAGQAAGEPPGGIDDIGVVGAVPDGPATAGLLDVFDPRWPLRLASLYLMKDRAGTVGFSGVGPLLRAILEDRTGPVYGVGHSFGAKVLLSAAVSAPVPRPLAGLLLLQPAISYLSFADRVPGREGPGGYRAVCDPDTLSGRILATYSRWDFPLHTIFHRALVRAKDLGEAQVAAGRTAAGEPPNAYAALGGYGPRGSGEALLEPLPEPGTALTSDARLVGLDGTLGKHIDGHGDVATPHAAWLLHLLMR